MADLEKVKEINLVIEEFFKQNSTLEIIPVKTLMPHFIKAGIFIKDIKNGMPIRQVLRELDKADELKLIPYTHAKRQEQSIYWYFTPLNASTPDTPYKEDENITTNKKVKTQSDESYVIDLCDSVLEQNAYRKKKFDFLLGDFHKDGESRTNIPVDAYYEDIKLVILYQPKWTLDSEKQHAKEAKKTISGITRAEQRERYTNRKTLTLPKHGIDVISISYSSFSCDTESKIIREKENNLRIIKEKLQKYLIQKDKID